MLRNLNFAILECRNFDVQSSYP